MDFTFEVLVAAVSAAKRGVRSTRKLGFDFAIRCVIEEMKKRNRLDLYMQARRIFFIAQQRKSAVEVVEYFGYSWESVTARLKSTPDSNTGVTPSGQQQNILESVEGYVNGAS